MGNLVPMALLPEGGVPWKAVQVLCVLNNELDKAQSRSSEDIDLFLRAGK